MTTWALSFQSPQRLEVVWSIRQYGLQCPERPEGSLPSQSSSSSCQEVILLAGSPGHAASDHSAVVSRSQRWGLRNSASSLPEYKLDWRSSVRETQDE